MILLDRLGEPLAGLTPDQEDLLEEVLRSLWRRSFGAPAPTRTPESCGGCSGVRPRWYDGCGKCWIR